MVPQFDVDGSGGVPPVPPRFSMSVFYMQLRQLKSQIHWKSPKCPKCQKYPKHFARVFKKFKVLLSVTESVNLSICKSVNL